VGKNVSNNIINWKCLGTFWTNDEVVSFFQLKEQEDFFKLKSLRANIAQRSLLAKL